MVSILATREVQGGCIGHPDQGFQYADAESAPRDDLPGSEGSHHLQLGEKYRVVASYVERLVRLRYSRPR